MLRECRKALKITTTDFDDDLCRHMNAAALDLKIAGVVLPGTVSFTVTTSGIIDSSTLTDDLCMQAIFSYVDWMFHKNAPNADTREKIYNIQKGQLMHASDYTDYGDEPEEAEEGDG